MNKSHFPVLKKRISSFLLSEDGKISKQSLLSLGSFAAAFALATAIGSKDVQAAKAPKCVHTNNLSLSFGSTGVHAVHSHSILPDNCA